MATIFDILRQEFGGGSGGLSNSIQQQLGATPEPTSSNVRDILAGRFETGGGPSFADYGSAIQQSAAGKPTNANDVAQANQLQQFEQMAKLQSMQPKQSSFANLLAEYESIPSDSPLKKFYEDKLTKETTVTQMGMPIPVFDPKTGQQTFATREQVIGGGYQPPTAKPTLSSTQQKTIFDSVDVINKSQAADSALTRALDLLEGRSGATPYTGAGSSTMASAGAIPGVGLLFDDQKVAATDEYNTLIKEQALSTMKAIFGGNPTEGERQVLLDMQAISSKTPEAQKRIIANAKTAINDRINNEQSKIQSIESGEGFSDYAPQSPQTPQQPVDKRSRLEQLRAKKAGLING